MLITSNPEVLHRFISTFTEVFKQTLQSNIIVLTSYDEQRLSDAVQHLFSTFQRSCLDYNTWAAMNKGNYDELLIMRLFQQYKLVIVHDYEPYLVHELLQMQVPSTSDAFIHNIEKSAILFVSRDVHVWKQLASLPKFNCKFTLIEL